MCKIKQNRNCAVDVSVGKHKSSASMYSTHLSCLWSLNTQTCTVLKILVTKGCACHTSFMLYQSQQIIKKVAGTVLSNTMKSCDLMI